MLGCGFNNIFPSENNLLYKKILENDGLVISEYPPYEKHQSKYFIARNRIISGISLGILVIEAGTRSGTSITANFGFKQNKKVFALPHEITNKYGIGTNKLLKKGAILVTDVQDILKELDIATTKKSSISSFSEITLTNHKYQYIYNLISNIPLSINELCKKTSKPISEISNGLFVLEIDGYIKKVAGGYVCTLNK